MAPCAPAAELWIGAATTSITPDRPVALDGQFHTRLSRGVDNPLTASAVAIEARMNGGPGDAVIFVSCDLAGIRPALLQPVRERLRAKLPDLDPRQVVLSATHTHTAPVTEEGKYAIPSGGVIAPAEYVAFTAERLADLTVNAWTQRAPGGVSWAIGEVVVGHNRRAVYADGSARMYGNTGEASFRSLEGGADHSLQALFFWDRGGRPLAACLLVPCPAQEVEGLSTLHADFWHEARAQFRAALSIDIPVLAWTGAAGDISPHRMVHKAAASRMLALRGLTPVQDIGRRIAGEAADLFRAAGRDVRRDVAFAHRIADLALPLRRITDEEAAAARRQAEELARTGDTTLRGAWHQAVADRHARQDMEADHVTEVHIVRIGDVAIATNPFELFQDYGLQIQGRSHATQTFVLQLTAGCGGYLPTRRAVEAGGYSAVVESCLVGPEGGEVLVDRTVEWINGLWDGSP
jgi:hypothetical protein